MSRPTPAPSQASRSGAANERQPLLSPSASASARSPSHSYNHGHKARRYTDVSADIDGDADARAISIAPPRSRRSRSHAGASAVADDDDDAGIPIKDRPVTPLPKLQMAIVCFVRMTEPITFMVCFPFINQMLLHVGAVDDPKNVGWPAGIIESVFSVTQLLTVFYWGSLSDRIGRKPVLIIGSLGCFLGSIGFGLSTSFWMMLVTRGFAGLMNGNVAVLKCVIGELSDETNESRAFSFFPLMLNAGTLIAAYVGGEFANVATKHPALAIPLFKAYPYLLPNILAALFPLLSALVSLIWLKETLPPHLGAGKDVDAETDSEGTAVARSGASDSDAGADDEYAAAPKSEIFNKRVNIVMFSFGVLSLMGSGILALHPLFCFTPINYGGLDFTEKQIGDAMSIRSVSVLVIQILAFPWLQRKVGTWRLYRTLMLFWIPTFMLLPVCNLLARGGHPVLVWVVFTISMVCGATANMAFVCNLLIVNEAAPTRRSLGAINGYAQAVSSFVRIIGPGGASILFAISVEKQILGGNLIWVVVGGITLLGVYSGMIMK